MSAASRGTNAYSGFSPTQFGNCQLWLDGDDTNTLYSDSAATTLASIGGTIGYWKDKSGNGRHYAQATAGNRPSYSSAGTIVFENTHCLINTSSWTTGVQYNIFAVVQPSTSTANWRTLLRGLTYDHPIIVQQGSTNLGYYNNAAGSFYQFGSLTLDGSSLQIITVSISATRGYSGSLGSSTASSIFTATGNGTADTNMFYYLGGLGGSQGWGTLKEIIICNDLTVEKTIAMQVYLYNKWNMTTGNVLSMDSKFNTFSRGFQPIDIEGCILWLDAQDDKTITLSGSNITAWNDKSGNNSHFTGSSGPRKAIINGAQYIDIVTNPTSYLVRTSFVLPTTYSVFTTGYSTITTATGPTYVGCIYAYPDAVFMVRGTNTLAAVFKGNASIWGGNTGSGASINTNGIWSVTNPTAAGPVTLFKNSQSISVNSGVTNVASSRLYLGTWGTSGSGNTWRGYYGDVIIYNRGLSTTERQTVEGYLAWKYNLQGELPSTHPFKFYRVPSQLFDPRSITTCIHWYDGSNIYTPVSAFPDFFWQDRSYAINASNFTSSVSIVQSDNYNLVDRTSGGTITTNSGSPSLPATYSIFAVCNTTLASGTTTLYAGRNAGVFKLECINGVLRASKGNGSTWATNSGTGATVTSLTVLSITNPSASGTLTLYRNGTSVQTASGVTNTTVTAGMSIGWTGYIGEIIVYDRGLTNSERFELEGYLAWKYNLQASLPSTHPFRNIKP